VDNKFALKYMNCLGHFEFGMNHKPFYFGDDESFNRLVSYSTWDINYWLLIWRNYYRYLLDNHTSNVVFFCFERYCSEPNEVLAKLYSIIDLDVMVCKPIEKFIPKMYDDSGVEKDILDECEEFFLMGSGTIYSWYGMIIVIEFHLFSMLIRV